MSVYVQTKKYSVAERSQEWEKLYRKDGKRYGDNSSAFCGMISPYIELHKCRGLLELGCGYGRDMFFLNNIMKQRGYSAQITGIDSSQTAFKLFSMEQESQKSQSLEFEVGDCLNQAPKIQQVDFVYSHLFLHLFLSDEISKLLHLIKDRLPIGGLFVNSCISVNDLKFGKGDLVANNCYCCYRDRPWHFIHFLSRKEIHELFLASGFRILKMFEYIETETILARTEESRAWFVVAAKE